jgi:hypothetical protein
MIVVADFDSVVKVYRREFGELQSGDNVVFDIDGTLLSGRTPIHQIVKWYKKLVDQGCNVYLVTARIELYRYQTICQLNKHNITGFMKLIMFDGSETDKAIPGSVAAFKFTAREDIGNVVLSVGDQWLDLTTNITSDMHSDNTQILIGPGFVKLPLVGLGNV